MNDPIIGIYYTGGEIAITKDNRLIMASCKRGKQINQIDIGPATKTNIDKIIQSLKYLRQYSK